MTKKLEEQIGDFLADRRKSDGGWAKITNSDIRALGEIIERLIAEKCEADPSGDYPINFRLVNRQEKYFLVNLAIAYEPTDRDLRDCTFALRHISRVLEEHFVNKIGSIKK